MESTKHSNDKTKLYILGMVIAGFILIHIGLAIYYRELQQTMFTKSLSEDVDTLLWVQIPAMIGVISGLVASVYRKVVTAWLMIVCSLVIMLPNLLVVSSIVTFFGGILYMVAGIVLLVNKKI